MKTCSHCKILKNNDEFYTNSAKSDGLASHCKKCNTLWVRKRYLSNKAYYHDKNKQARKRNAQYLLLYLLDHPCVDCGEKDPIVLDFDHISGTKIYSLSRMASTTSSIETINREIEKCVVRCANCHRRKTAKEQSWYRFIALETTD